MNSPNTIKTRYLSSKLSWWPVLLFLPARLIFAFIAQALTAGFIALQGSTSPWLDAGSKWPVYSTITDIFCLASLALLTRREHIKLLDLVGVRDNAILKQLAWTPAYLLAVAPSAFLAHLITQAYYGTSQPPMISIVNLSPAGALYSLLIWPVIWVITEELVYLGYLLPRIEVLSKKTWLAVIVVTFFWGFQHLGMPFILDWKYIVSRIVTAIVAVSGFTIVFVLWRRRLVPLIGCHYIADLLTAFLVGVSPLISGT